MFARTEAIDGFDGVVDVEVEDGGDGDGGGGRLGLRGSGVDYAILCYFYYMLLNFDMDCPFRFQF